MQTIEKTVKYLAPYQPLLEEKYRYLIFHGGRYSGKSYHVALALLLRGQQKKLRILCTREIQNTIKDSVHKLLKDIIDENEYNDYEVTETSIINKITGSEFIFKGLKINITEVKSMEGIDVCWVEEAQNITNASLDILVPTIRKEGSQMIFTFNRYLELDPVYVRFVMNPKPNSYIRQVNYDVMERNGMLTDVIRQEIESDKKEDPDIYAHIWLGQPLNQSDRAIISRTDILAAMNRELTPEGATEVGVDVARLGDDRTVFYKRKGLVITSTEIYKKQRLTETFEKLVNFIDADKEVLIKVDDTGVGGGLTDQLIHHGYRVMPINFGGEPSNKDKYPNIISEAWFYLKSIINTIQIPNDNLLLMELSNRQWKMDSKGRRAIESKDDYRKRGFKSPDLADALVLTFFRGYVGSYDNNPPEKRGDTTDRHQEGNRDPLPARSQTKTDEFGFSNLQDKVF